MFYVDINNFVFFISINENVYIMVEGYPSLYKRKNKLNIYNKIVSSINE